LPLAFRKGVQTAGDAEKMCRRVAVFQDVQGRLVLRGEERRANRFGGPTRRVRERVDFDSVACRQEDDFGPRWAGSARLPQRGIRGLAQQPFSRVEI